MGPAIGWVDVDEDAIYFDPTPAYRAVQRQLDASPTRLTINERTLWKRMEEEGLLASHEPGRHTAKLRVGRATHNTLHLSLSLLLGESRTSRTSPHVTPDAAALVRTEDVFPERTGPVPDVPDPSGEIENTSASAREGAETGRFEFAGDEAWRIHDA